MNDVERKIYVRNKQGELISVFSNQINTSQNEKAIKNLMIAPTISIESNGASTLSFQMLSDSEKWQQIKDPENIYECNGRIYTALNEQSIRYQGNLVDVTLVENWYLLDRKYAQVHNVDTNIEALDIHTVKILPKSKGKLTINGKTYDDSDVKDISGAIMPRGSAGYALWALLKATGDWQLGICDVLPQNFSAENDYGTFNVESDMKDILYNIKLVQQLYGGILDWDSKNKILNLRDERKESDFNEWNGYSVRKEKNLAEQPTIIWDNRIITRLYPLGNGNLNIKKANNGIHYVENFSYTKDIYEGYLQNSNIYYTNDDGGSKTLKFWGEQQLEKYCRPRKSITYTVMDLRNTEKYKHETFDINNIVKCYYTDTETNEEVFEYLRIIKLSYDYFNLSNDSVINVGDKVENEIDLFFQTYNSTENSAQTSANGNISGFDISIEIPEAFFDRFGGFGYTNLNNITELYAEKMTDNTAAIASVRVYADETFATIENFTLFEENTKENFQQSYTAITQVSNALSAQISLEASHYQKLKGDVNSVSSSLASFVAEANNKFATTSQLSQYSTTDQVNGLISKSEASIKTYASQNYASISLQATVNTLNERTANIDNKGGYLVITSSYSKIGYPGAGQFFIYESGSVSLASVTLSINSTGTTLVYAGGTLSLNGGSVSILGSKVKWNKSGYLVKA